VPSSQPTRHQGVECVAAYKTRHQRLQGLWPDNARGEIEFKDVELYYPARPNRRVLNGLSLKIDPGSVVALVGESGGGKSSIVSLIQHLYEPSSGQVLLDGYSVHDLAPAWLSQHVSVVSQQPTLFGRSIRQNIMYGLEGTSLEPSQQEIEAAAKLAHADGFIESMPAKYVVCCSSSLNAVQPLERFYSIVVLTHPLFVLLASSLDTILMSEHAVFS